MTTVLNSLKKDQRVREKRFGWWVMAILAWLVVAYSVQFLLWTPASGQAVKAAVLEDPGASGHIWASIVAMALGPLQLHRGFRERFVSVHRALGFVYLLAVVIGGVLAVYVAPNSETIVSDIGFAALGAAWVTATVVAFDAVIRGRFRQHGKMMIVSFALTYAAVCLRIETPLFSAYGVPRDIAASIIAWSCWVPNLAFVWFFFIRPRNNLTDRDPSNVSG